MTGPHDEGPGNEGRNGAGGDRPELTGPGGTRPDGGALRTPSHAPREPAGPGSVGAPSVEVAPPPHAGDVDPAAERRAERMVAFWFTLSTLSTLGFVATFWEGDEHAGWYTPLLGLTMGIALASIGIGAVLWAKKLMPDEEAVQEREPHHSPENERLSAVETFKQGAEATQFMRRPLLRRSLLGAFGAIGLLGIWPLRSLGPLPHNALFKTSWKAGSRLVTEQGNPVKLGDMAIGGMMTVFPEGANVALEHADSPVVLIRLRPGENKPLPGRENWEVDGHVAYSKICTHLGCPVGLYEQQTHHLLCPCHQSVFDVVDHAKRIFGPARRPLPQLALAVDKDGNFIAQHDFTEPIGPGFWEH